jgi:hypothetical protein
MGFMALSGSTRAAMAWRAWERAISAPSGVTVEFKEVFWALKGATLRPLSAKILQRAAAIRDLPAKEEVPWTMMDLALMYRDISPGY